MAYYEAGHFSRQSYSIKKISIILQDKLGIVLDILSENHITKEEQKPNSVLY